MSVDHKKRVYVYRVLPQGCSSATVPGNENQQHSGVS